MCLILLACSSRTAHVASCCKSSLLPKRNIARFLLWEHLISCGLSYDLYRVYDRLHCGICGLSYLYCYLLFLLSQLPRCHSCHCRASKLPTRVGTNTNINGAYIPARRAALPLFYPLHACCASTASYRSTTARRPRSAC